MGSKSDEEKVRPCADVLKELGISFTITVSSAHRTPERTREIVREQEEAGAQVFVCAAGMAAHLAGAVAAITVKPVIGIPLSADGLAGMDALFSTVQMPPGYPVAAVALNKAGACNAAWLAAQILALSEPALREKIEAARAAMREEVKKAGEDIQKKYAAGQ
jgi:5-(carboxyamino)imidazole ribonucleotide mutase